MKAQMRVAAVLLAAITVPMAAAPASSQAAPAVGAGDDAVSFDVYLPLRNRAQLDKLLVDQQAEGSPQYHKWLTPDQFQASFGPSAASQARVRAALLGSGMRVVSSSWRSFHVAGSAAQAGGLLGTRMTLARHADGRTSIQAAQPMTMAPALRAEGARVVSFTGVPAHRPFATKAAASAIPANRYGQDGPYWFDDLKQAYDYPSYESTLPSGARLDGTGVSVAILMSDTLYPHDVGAFFNHEKFATVTKKPAPIVRTVLINGGGTQGGPGTFEASLDVQQVLGGAPGAKVTLVSLPDLSDDNVLAGYRYIVDHNSFDVVNSSFGECELFYTPAYNGGVDYTDVLKTYDEIFSQGNVEGITFVASSGDNGGLECPAPKYLNGEAAAFQVGVSSPAASAYVTAVGGTNLLTVTSSSTLDSTYLSENGYGDPLVAYDPYGVGANARGGYWGAGGGISQITLRPSYQKLVNTGSTTFRTVPDIGMQVGGCPFGISKQPCGPDRSAAVTAYDTDSADGGFFGVIGTSVSSPEFVGALALYEQSVGGRLGNINTFLYKSGATQTKAGGVKAGPALQFYHRDIPGFDGVYDNMTPSADYNYIVGNGTVDVRNLFRFRRFAAAGIPQTPSNP